MENERETYDAENGKKWVKYETKISNFKNLFYKFAKKLEREKDKGDNRGFYNNFRFELLRGLKSVKGDHVYQIFTDEIGVRIVVREEGRVDKIEGIFDNETSGIFYESTKNDEKVESLLEKILNDSLD